jgi:hypothetical protein
MNALPLAVGWVFACAICGGLLVVAVDRLIWRRKRRRLVADGTFPQPGTETEEDVQRLLRAGQPDAAIRCYQTIHHVSYQRAKDQLIAPPVAEYVHFPVGFLVGIAIGAAVRNIGLGFAIGLVLGSLFTFLHRKRRTP